MASDTSRGLACDGNARSVTVYRHVGVAAIVDRLRGIDGLRGVAILLVVACHAGVPGLEVGGGTAGVTVFFVLSGFLITRILLRREPLSDFYVRRAARLMPALILMLVVVGVWYMGAGLDTRSLAIGAAFTLSYVANWVPLSELGPLLHTWSISVEEQFYLVWPILLWLLPRRRLTVVLCAVIVASLVLRGVVSHPHAIRGTDTNAYALAAGALLASVNLRRAPLAALCAGSALVAMAALGPRDFGHDFLWGVDFRWSPPIAAAGSVLLVWVTATHDLSAPRWLVHVGDVSYGWYLWHLPLMIAFNFGVRDRLIAAGVALLCAEASLRYVERPIRRWARDRSRIVHPAPPMPTPDGNAPRVETESLRRNPGK